MREKCNNCVYSCPVDMGEDCEMLRACVYILCRGERRPCGPGEACTVYEPVPERRPKPWL